MKSRQARIRTSICIMVPVSSSLPEKSVAPVLNDIARLSVNYAATVLIFTNNAKLDQEAFSFTVQKKWAVLRSSETLSEPAFLQWCFSIAKNHTAQYFFCVPPYTILHDHFFTCGIATWDGIKDPTKGLLSLVGAVTRPSEIASNFPEKVRQVSSIGSSFIFSQESLEILSAWNSITHGSLEKMFKGWHLYTTEHSLIQNLIGKPWPIDFVEPVVPKQEPPIPAAVPPTPHSAVIHRQEPPKPRPKAEIKPGSLKAAFLVATHHRPKLLELCLDQLTDQIVPDGWHYEVLVAGTVDDPGKDVVKKFPDTRYVDVPTTTVTSKLNALLNETDAVLVMKADDDDLQPKNRLQAAVGAYSRGAKWSGVGTILFYDLTSDRVMRWSGQAKWGLVGTSMNFNTALLKGVGGWPERVKGEDGALVTVLKKNQVEDQFIDVTADMGIIVCLQHDANLYKRPVVEMDQKTTRGGFSVSGEGRIIDSTVPSDLKKKLQGFDPTFSSISVTTSPIILSETPIPAARPVASYSGDKLITCIQGEFGQMSYIHGLKAIGFQSTDYASAAQLLKQGVPVLFHGWRSAFRQLGEQYPGRVFTLWHSGWTGSDLMGEGNALAEAMVAANEGAITLLWLERRDICPPKAIPIAPIWDPDDIKRLAVGAKKKRPRSVMVAFHGAWSAPCKNDLASIAACTGIGADLHISQVSLDGPRGVAIRQLLTRSQHNLHGNIVRAEAVKLMAEMDLMCHVSLSDTWPFATMEAVYAGTPVIGSPAVSWMQYLPDEVKRSCVIDPPTSSLAIHQAVVQALNIPSLRESLLRAQQEALDKAWVKCRKDISDTLMKCGFPVARSGPETIRVDDGVINVMIDSPNWAFDRIIDRLQEHLPFRFQKHYTTAGKPIHSGILFWWRGFSKFILHPEQSMLCVFDHISWDVNTVRTVFSKFKVIGVGNQHLHDQLRAYKELDDIPIFVVADGVDTSRFFPDRDAPNAKLQIGWVGNSKWGGGQDIKGIEILNAVRAATSDICDWHLADKASGGIPFEDMPDFYHKLDIISCFSLVEGTPNPALEGAASGCLPISTNVGLLQAMADSGCVVKIVNRTAEAFISEINTAHWHRYHVEQARSENPRVMQETWDWKVRSKIWHRAIDRLLERPEFISVPTEAVDASGKDFRDKLTVFITTVGAPDFPECLRYLQNQDCVFNLRVIKNVAPMDAAFQKMIDECKTEFYVQVDEDMLLDPHAIRTLYEDLAGRPENVAIYFRGLRDVFTGLNLIGVKIYRHRVMQRYPYNSRDFSCEVDQIERMKKDGYSVDGTFPGLEGDSRQCIGDLNVFWTPRGVFEKYARDLQKYRLYPVRQNWMEMLPALFLRKVKENPKDVIAQFALFGAMTGLAGPVLPEGEKDFRNMAFRDVFRKLISTLKVNPDEIHDVRGGIR